MNGYRYLDAWQKAMLLGKDVYRITRDFPRQEI